VKDKTGEDAKVSSGASAPKAARLRKPKKKEAVT
jgi:hypothetical protein